MSRLPRLHVEVFQEASGTLLLVFSGKRGSAEIALSLTQAEDLGRRLIGCVQAARTEGA